MSEIKVGDWVCGTPIGESKAMVLKVGMIACGNVYDVVRGGKRIKIEDATKLTPYDCTCTDDSFRVFDIIPKEEKQDPTPCPHPEWLGVWENVSIVLMEHFWGNDTVIGMCNVAWDDIRGKYVIDELTDKDRAMCTRRFDSNWEGPSPHWTKRPEWKHPKDRIANDWDPYGGFY